VLFVDSQVDRTISRQINQKGELLHALPAVIYSYNNECVTAMQKKTKRNRKNPKQKNIFADMGLSHLRMMAATIQEIHDECAISDSHHVKIASFDDRWRHILARNKVIEFLLKEKVVEVRHEQHGNSYSRWDIEVVDQEALTEYAKQLKVAMMPYGQQKVGSSAASHSQKKAVSSPIEYRVSMNEAGEVLINETKICRPHRDSENAWVIKYLCNHPNRTFSKESLHAKRKDAQPESDGVGKDLRKIAENLGFVGDLQKAFFELHKRGDEDETILLRDPVTRKELIEYGVRSGVLNLKRKSKIRRKNKKPKKT